MKTFVRILLGAQLVLILVPFAAAQTLPAVPDKATPTEKPRVFITDSQSWEMRGSAGGANGAFGAQTHGGARPQTAEIIKTFGERCPTAMVNNRQEAADYIVLLDHEGGKGLLSHKNKVAVFEKVSGDVVVSHSTLSLGGSVQEACEALTKHWNEHGTQLRAASNVKVAPISQVPPELNKAAVIQPKLSRKHSFSSRSFQRRPSSRRKEERLQILGTKAESYWRGCSDQRGIRAVTEALKMPLQADLPERPARRRSLSGSRSEVVAFTPTQVQLWVGATFN